MAGKKFQVLVTVYDCPRNFQLGQEFDYTTILHNTQHILLQQEYSDRAEATGWAKRLEEKYADDGIKFRAKSVVTG